MKLDVLVLMALVINTFVLKCIVRFLIKLENNRKRSKAALPKRQCELRYMQTNETHLFLHSPICMWEVCLFKLSPHGATESQALPTCTESTTQAINRLLSGLILSTTVLSYSISSGTAGTRSRQLGRRLGRLPPSMLQGLLPIVAN